MPEHDSWQTDVQKQELQQDYILFMQRSGIMRKVSAVILGKFLGRVCPNGMPKSYQKMAKVNEIGSMGEHYSVNRRTYFYQLPSLEDCRAQWDKSHGAAYKWNAPLDKGEQIGLPEEAIRPAEEAFK